MAQIIVKFSLIDGEARVEAMGFKGSSCSDATRFLKETLGESSDFQRKAEWYEAAIQTSNGRIVNSNLCG